MSDRRYLAFVVAVDLCVWVCTLCAFVVFTDFGLLHCFIAANLAAVAVNVPLILTNLAKTL